MTAEPRWKTIADLKSQLHRQALALEKARQVAELFEDRMSRYGEWNEGCFYYSGKSAPEFQQLIREARKLLALLPSRPLKAGFRCRAPGLTPGT